MLELPLCRVGKTGLRVTQLSNGGKVSYAERALESLSACWEDNMLPHVLIERLNSMIHDGDTISNKILLVTGDLYAGVDHRVFTVYTTQGVTYTVSTKGCFCTGGWSYSEIPLEVTKLHRAITDGGRQLESGAFVQMLVGKGGNVHWVSADLATQGDDIVDDVDYFVFVDKFTGYPLLCGINKRDRITVITSIGLNMDTKDPEYELFKSFNYKLELGSGLLVDLVRKYQEIDNMVYPLFDDRLDRLLGALKHFDELCACVFYGCMQLWLQQKERVISLLCGEFCVTDLSCLSDRVNADFEEAMLLFNAEIESTYPCITQNKELYSFYMEEEKRKTWSLFGLPQHGTMSIFLKAENCILKTGSLYTGSYNFCFYLKNIIGVDDKTFVVEHMKPSAVLGAGARGVDYYLEPCDKSIIQRLLTVQKSGVQTALMVYVEDWKSAGKLSDLTEALADFYLSCYYARGGVDRYLNVNMLNEPVICNGTCVEVELGISYGVLNFVKDSDEVKLSTPGIQNRYYGVIAQLVLNMIEKCNLSAWYQDKQISFNLKNEHVPNVEMGAYNRKLPFLYNEQNYWCAVEYAEYERTMISAIEKVETYVIPLCLAIGQASMGEYYTDLLALKSSIPWYKNKHRSSYEQHMRLLQAKLTKDNWNMGELKGYRVTNYYDNEVKEHFRYLLSQVMLGLHKGASQLVI